MAIQSCTPVIVLTRPASQSQRFAREVKSVVPKAQVVITPLMSTRFSQPALPDLPFQAVIFSSETAVQAAVGLGVPLPTTAFCVGDRTAQAATRAGFAAQSAAGDVVALKQLIEQSGVSGPLLHLRGRESAGELAKTLTEGGIETHSVIAYSQDALPLTEEALRILGTDSPVIVPLFSPRSARLLHQALGGPPRAPLWIVAISANAAAAAQALGPARLNIARHPDGENMLHAVAEMAISAGKA